MKQHLKYNNINADIDENLAEQINCKYYTADEFSKLKPTEKSLELFHRNVDSITCHFDNLNQLLASTKIGFNVICISETKRVV